MEFESGIACINPQEKGFWFLFKDSNLLSLKKNDTYCVPEFVMPSEMGIKTGKSIYLGKADGKNCWAADVYADEDLMEGHCDSLVLEYKNLRELYPHLGDALFALAGRALQLKNWSSTWNYCPSCGSALDDSKEERAKICISCSKVYYPVISPAIIVAVTKGDRILLARNNRFQNVKRFSILAGFVEAGESLEETVAREVLEEVGIKVKNIQYFGSQSWPFPHSLMLGFTAEHDSGDIKVDGVEIGEAAWFSASTLPEIPPYGSISRSLIDDFIKKHTRHA